MKRIFQFFLFLSIQSLHLNSFEFSTAPLYLTEGAPSSVVDGHVSVIGGSFVDQVEGIYIPGPEPVSLTFFYNSAYGWDNSLRGYIASLENRAFTRELSGSEHLSTWHGYNGHFDMALNRSGFTNCGQGEISAQTNPKNTALSGSKDKKTIYSSNGSGEQLVYSFSYLANQSDAILYPVYAVNNILKPSGNKLFFTYKKHTSVLKKLEAKNLLGDKSFGEISYNKKSWTWSCLKQSIKEEMQSFSLGSFSDAFHSGKLTSQSKTKLSVVQPKEFIRSHAPSICYLYRQLIPHQMPMICGKWYSARPDHRFELEYARKDNSSPYKIKTLKAPIGTGKTLLPKYTFTYYKDRTDVQDALGFVTAYHVSNQRISHIDSYEGTSSYPGDPIAHIQRYFWGSQGRDEGHLISYAIEDGKGNVLKVESNAYGERGNIVAKRLWGQITGEGEGIKLSSSGIPTSGEFYEKSARYSHDLYNLLLEQKEGKLTHTYTYEPKSNRLSTIRLTDDTGATLRRTFCEYNDCGVMVTEIIDDGHGKNLNDTSGVSLRKITRVKPKAAAPCLGFPEEVKELYWDPQTNEEKLIVKKVNTYTPEGWLKSQTIYDAFEEAQYTIEKRYDKHGHVIWENDPLGGITERQFDEIGNLTYEKGPKGDCEHTYFYDCSDRLIEKKTTLSTGEVLSTQFEYDLKGNQTAVIDIYGQRNEFRYGALGRMVEKQLSPVKNEHGELVIPKESYTYDTLGNPTSVTDARGNTTTTTYNVLGKPLHIAYPDGTEESYLYNLDGTLKRETTKTGTTIHYSYDSQQRPIEVCIYSFSGELLSKCSTCYDAFNKISETDPEGHTTYYFYDAAGRLTKTQRGDGVVTLTYDSLSRLKEKRESYGDGRWKVIHFTYDLSGKILEERVEEEGTLLKWVEFAYDANGNKIEDILHAAEGISISRYEYDSLNRIVCSTAPDGAQTHTFYDHKALDELGNRVLRQVTTDPLGRITEVLHDTYHRIASIKRYADQLLEQNEIDYDIVGNKSAVHHHRIINGQTETILTTRMDYNPVGQLTKLTEAVGTANERVTKTSYNTFGQKWQWTKPDGTILTYTYSALGRLERLISSDGTIDYGYRYDRNGNITAVEDHITGRVTNRDYNQQGLLLHELQSSGLELSMARDSLGRVTNLHLPDGSSVSYKYDALHLREVHYLGYIHSYEEYDLTGHLKKSRMAGKGQTVTYKHDSCQRIQSIESPYWKEDSLLYDSASRLIEAEITDTFNKKMHRWQYDPLDQLISEEGFETHSYSHDSLHNRKSKDETPYQHNSLNQLTAEGNTDYTYDPNGNLIEQKSAEGMTVFTYDALNRLTSITKNNTRTLYIYDSFHRRVEKREEQWAPYTIIPPNLQSHWQPTNITRYLYHGNLEIGAFQNGKFKELRILGHGRQGDIGASVFIISEGRTFTPIHDHNGNICCLINPESGEAKEVYHYTAFGEEKLYQASGKNCDSPSSPWRFSSKRVEGHLIHFGRRDYDPRTGRWITPDPIGISDGPNLYAYVKNNPVTFIDPTGLSRNSFIRPEFSDKENKNLVDLLNITKRTLIDCSTAFGLRPSPGLKPSQPAPKEHIPYRLPKKPEIKKLRLGSFPLFIAERFDLDRPEFNADRLMVTWTNGIYNTLEDSKDSARYISDHMGGYEVHGVYSELDIREARRRKNGECGAEEDELVELWTDYIKEAPEDAVIYHYCHSGGTAVTRNALKKAPKWVRDRIKVVAISPYAYTNEENCKKIDHYVSNWDTVPLWDGAERERCKDTVHVLKAHPDASFHDHEFQSPTFEAALHHHLVNAKGGR